MKIISIFLSLTLMLSFITPISAVKSENKFITVSGKKLLENGKEYVIKGIAFGNDVWSNNPTPIRTHHTEDSYRVISEFGFNSVRFYLDYEYFENDKEPYKYKSSGFKWLDENIEWAKKYGIKLVLNMHVPQGGYQSQGKGTALWTDKENQKRLTALWKKIAKRYKNEPTIIGYGLINEPGVPLLETREKSIKQYSNYVKSLVKELRTVDKNHLIFVEKLCFFTDTKTGETNWNVSAKEGLFKINDKKIVYEFHNYTPHSFTHQDMDWAGTLGVKTSYPSDDIIPNWEYKWLGCHESLRRNKTEDGWTFYESEKVAKSPTYNIGNISLRGASLGNGIAYFDNVVITEYDSKGGKKIIKEVDFETDENFSFWSENGDGERYIDEKIGYKSSSSLAIKGTTKNANSQSYYFEMKDDCSYTISCWVKGVNVDKNAAYYPRIDFSYTDNIQKMNKEYLKNDMQKFLDFGDKYNVPLYLGEFGTCKHSFERGGTKWVSDMLDICIENKISFNYHTFHEYAFGLYQNDANSLPDDLNKELAKVFENKLK